MKSINLLISGLVLSALISCKPTSNYDLDNFLLHGTEENPYQIVKESQTLKIFVPRGSQNPHFNEMKMFKKLSEITNLNFNFTEVDSSAYTQVRSATWEDKKNLPDLFLFNNSTSEQVYYGAFGALVPFNDDEVKLANGYKIGNVIDNFMPTYKGLLDNNFNINNGLNAKKVATFADGKMYSTLSVNDVPRDLTFKMFINQQWIDNLQEDGVQIKDAVDIETIEDYIEVLKAFKKYDANRNGKDDEVPVTAKELEYLRNYILASYGYAFPGIELSGDEIIYVPKTEAYKKYLQTMRLLETEGLLDISTFSIKTDAQMAQKGLEHRLGSFSSAAAYLTVGMNYESEYVCITPLKSSYYTGTPMQWGFSTFYPTGAVIPSGTNYIREVARLLDIMYSDLGIQLIAYGEENVDWQWDNEEKTSWTFNVPNDWKGTQEEYRATITPNVGTASALYWKNDFVGKMNDAILTKLNTMSSIYTPYIKVVFPEEVKMTNDEYNEIELINASLQAYQLNAEYQFIKEGKNTNGEDWTKYLSNLDKYNVGRLEEIYQNAYNRFKGV
ncbi:MAG: hypothetical protein LBM99_02755 [Bacillales bacterium]|jgi:putative aldouronate transport system substrate-binding protein|nr:hypothetical protein [Bacillales bacterium]